MTEPTDADWRRASALLTFSSDPGHVAAIAQALADERARALEPIRTYLDECHRFFTEIYQ